MAKASKTVPQKEKASSSSSRPAGDKTPVEPLPHEYVPGPCILKSDFKIENPSSVPGRCEHVSRPDQRCNIEAPERRGRGQVLGSEVGERQEKEGSLAVRGPQTQTSKRREEGYVSQVDSVRSLRDKEEEEEEEDDASALVARPRKSIEAAKPSEPEAAAENKPHDEEAFKKGSGDDPESPEAFTKSRVDLSQCEAELQRTPEERNALNLLCGQKDESLKDLRVDLAKARMEEAELDEQAKRIEELEAELAEAKAEVEKTKVLTDKSIAIYLADAEAAQTQLRDTSDRERLRNDLAKCESRRETLKEIHARGFDLSEEIAQAKALEADAMLLASSDNEDDDDEGSRGGSDNGKGPEGEATPDEEVDPDHS
ncbi:uncharacterized protein [Nicotiana tomentosiformis]|uniref:uncharacterized protein n=1 Tax=Nicotiana tomentosiformis TaxID=4098 RepID=UPI00388CA374